MVLTGFIRDFRRTLPDIRQAAVADKPVVIRIIERNPAGDYTASILGTRVKVKSSLTLSPNTILKASVSVRGNTLLMKILPDKDLPIPRTPADYADLRRRAVFETLKQAGIPAASKTAAAFAEFAGKYKAETRESLRLAAVLFDKGLQPSEDDFRVLEGYVSPYPREEGRGKRDGNKDEGRQKKDAEDLAARIKAAVSSGGPVKPGFLALFNHVRSCHDDWVLVPFSEGGENPRLTGVIRMKPTGDGRAIESLVVSVSSGTFSCHVSIPRYRENPKQARLYADFHGSLKDIKEPILIFRQNIGKQNCILDDTINTCAGFDGFSEVSETPRKAVDYEA